MTVVDWRAAAAPWWASASWWASPEWHAYERAYGDEPGTRTRLLASATWRTRVLDLTPKEADLWRGIRKSYKSLINRARRIYPIVQPETLMPCRLIHRQAAGRVTRSSATWDLMESWRATGHGLAMMALTQTDEPVAFAYFIMHQGWAYYASGASLRESVQHAVTWVSLLALKAHGIHTAELGWQGQAQDEKGKQIEFFKTGFGGEDVGLDWTSWRTS